ncbi:polysaccharide biosynthesis protein [Haladaptatus sp. W1]|uniref:oligosaccharide flippase family protein n=1 Tax=Haladaptatus sp. W1 TaxID=1897478 RepID=UPI000849D4EB|nr:polysaccharide biosynthesis C-terminal domain-containing protein [Haladaptatus sp. W1]ODR81773.1 polysaccharide biosynthesis protein [Haladaptatus sp. W1]
MQRSILSGVLSVAGTKVLTLVIGIMTTPILYRLLGPTGIGVYTTVLSVFSLFMILVSSGISDGVRKFIAEEHEMDCWEEYVVGFYFRLALVLAVAGAILLALATWTGVVAWIFGPEYELYFYLLTVMTIASQFQAYARRTLMGFGLERYSEPLKVVQRVTFIVVALPLVYYMRNRGMLEIAVLGALAGKIAAAAMVAVIGFALIIKRTSLRSFLRSTPEDFPRRRMLAFNSLSIVLILLLMSLYHVDILMLQLMSGSNEQVGYYRAALKLAEFLWFIPMALQTVFVHSTSELWSNGKTERISKLSARTTRYTFLLTGVMGLGLAALANIAVPVYFSAKYLPAVTPLLLLLPGSLGFAVARPILAISQGKGDLKYPIIATGTAAGINFVLNFLLIPRYGMQGAAVSTSIGYGSMFVFHLWSARKVGFDPLSDARLGRILGTTILSAPPIFVLARVLDVRPLIAGFHVPLALALVPPLGLGVFTFFAFATGALGFGEVFATLSSFPEPLSSRAETLQTKVRENTMSSDSIQKLMVVTGILLFVSGIGYAFLDPGIGGIGGVGGANQGSSINNTQTVAGTTVAETTHGTTPTKSTTEQKTTQAKSTTEKTSTSPSTTTTDTNPPPSTTSDTNPPPSTTTTTSPPTTTTTSGTTTTTTTTSTTTTTTTTTGTTTTTSGASTTSQSSTTTTGSTAGTTSSPTDTTSSTTSSSSTSNTTTNSSSWW